MERDYNDAIEALNSLQTNYSVLKALRDAGKSGANEPAIPEMIEWLRRLGYEPSDLNKLNVIHIAGTKGKGSTCAFISSILSQYPEQFPKIGLYTSPHLRTVRERIQINNTPLAPDTFAKYFFETWDRLSSCSHALPSPSPSTDASGHVPLIPPPSEKAKPGYFRFLTLTALHAFLREKVDVVILECGVGGEYDSTNIVPAPVVTAVTSLGYDHTPQLGSDIKEIAWHKSGIFKRGGVNEKVFSADGQGMEADGVLWARAKEKGKSLEIVPKYFQIERAEIELGLEGDFQQLNASVACEVAGAFMRQTGHQDAIGDVLPNPYSIERLPLAFTRGLKRVRWGGRCETRQDVTENLTWYIDGCHTSESVQSVCEWYNSYAWNAVPRVLLFNQQTRDAPSLLEHVYRAVADRHGRRAFHHAVFCTNNPYGRASRDGKGDMSLTNKTADQKAVHDLEVQKQLAECIPKIDEACGASGTCTTHVVESVESAVLIIRDIAKGHEEVPVLATGSLHLVGGLLEVLEGENERN